MEIRFTKMHGIGNDYIYINCMDGVPFDPAALSVAMSPHRFSVGGDGIILICASDVADAKMRIFNADGSEAMMCGNGIRCVGKYLYDYGIVPKTEIAVETLSGVKYLSLTVENGKAKTIRVDMGKASFAPEAIPTTWNGEMVNAPVPVAGETYNITGVSMGNPHGVVYVDDPAALDLAAIGPAFEHNPVFPNRVNTEFVKIADPTHLIMRVWERGSGETYACGTGACAVAAASVKNGYSPADTPITVKLLGGELTITARSDWSVTMEGPAEKVYEGVYEYESAAE